MQCESNSHLSLAELDGILPENEVHVWLLDLNIHDSNVSSLSGLLNTDERVRSDRFKVEGARIQFVVSRAYLRIVLGKYLGIDSKEVSFRVTSLGKPELVDNREIRFNLSHTQGLTAIGITRGGDLGIDVERIREETNAVDLAYRFFSKKEADWVRAQPEAERVACFLSCWTAKEAYIKAHGAGLSLPLDGFAIIPESSNLKLQLAVFENPVESEQWSIWRLDLKPPFKGALAIKGKDCIVRVGYLPQS